MIGQGVNYIKQLVGTGLIEIGQLFSGSIFTDGFLIQDERMCGFFMISVVGKLADGRCEAGEGFIGHSHQSPGQLCQI